MNVIVVDELPADLLLGLNFCNKMGLLLDCSEIISSVKIVCNENQGKEVVAINSIESNKTAQ
jgi:hypothetical protein